MLDHSPSFRISIGQIFISIFAVRGSDLSDEIVTTNANQNFIFDEEQIGGEWCGWLANTSSQASSSLWVCPIAIKFWSGDLFAIFNRTCDEQDVNSQDHQTTSKDSRFLVINCSEWYSEDIIMGLYIIYLYIVWCCEHISPIQNVLSYLGFFIMYTKWHFTLR